MRLLALSHSAVVASYRAKWGLLARRPGWELCLAVPGRWPEGGAMVPAAPGARVLGVRLPGRVGFFTYKGLKELAAEFKPDLVYAEEEPYSLAAFQALRLAPKFAFFSWENIRGRRYKPPLNWVLKRVLKGSAGAVYGTEESRSCFGFSGPSAVVPQYGVDTRAFRPAPRKAGRPFRAGFVGRLVPEKGCGLFLEACAKAGVQAVVAGQGPEEARLKALAPGARFLGFVPFERRRALFREFDVLALPSLSTPRWKEQFGRVIIEAAACGIPCVGSDSGAIPEVVGGGGLIFPEGDAGALAARLRRLAASAALRRKLGLAARARAVKHYDDAVLAKRLGDFLERLIA